MTREKWKESRDLSKNDDDFFVFYLSSRWNMVSSDFFQLIQMSSILNKSRDHTNPWFKSLFIFFSAIMVSQSRKVQQLGFVFVAKFGDDLASKDFSFLMYYF